MANFADEVRKLQRILRPYVRFATLHNPSQTTLGDRRYSLASDNSGSVPIKGTAASLGTLTRSLINFDQDMEIPTVTLDLTDPDNEWRTLASKPYQLVNRWLAHVLRIYGDDGTANDSVISKGQVTSYDFPEGGKVGITLQILPGEFLGDKIPRRLVSTEDWPSADTSVVGQPVPIIYGRVENPSNPSSGRPTGGAVKGLLVNRAVGAIVHGLAVRGPINLGLMRPDIWRTDITRGHWGGDGHGADQLPTPTPNFYMWVTWVDTYGSESPPSNMGTFNNPGGAGWSARVTFDIHGAFLGLEYRVYIADASDFHPFNGIGSATIARVKSHGWKPDNNHAEGEKGDNRTFWGALTEGTDYISVVQADGQYDYLLAGHALKSVIRVFVTKSVVYDIVSLTRVGGLVTATTSIAHQLVTGDDVTISGADQSEYNLTEQITVLTNYVFQYLISTIPTTPATGTIKATGRAPLPVLQTLGTDYTTSVKVKNGNSYHVITFGKDQGTNAVTADVEGIEAVGDGTGALISKGPDAFYHFLNNWVLQDYRTGSWFPDSLLLKKTSFDAASLVSTKRVGALGYVVGGFLMTQAEARVLIKDWLTSFDMDMFIDNCQKIQVLMFDPTLYNRNTVSQYRPQDAIFKMSFRSTPDISKIANHIDWSAGLQLNNGYLLGGIVSDADSILNYGATYKRPLMMNWTRDQATAENVANWLMRKVRNPPMKATFKAPVKALNDAVASIVAVTHEDGVAESADGWDRRLCQITRSNINYDKSLVTLEVVDMDAFILSLGLAFWGDRTWSADHKNWLTTTEDKRSIYMYWSDRTTMKFSNGDPPKKWI